MRDPIGGSFLRVGFSQRSFHFETGRVPDVNISHEDGLMRLEHPSLFEQCSLNLGLSLECLRHGTELLDTFEAVGERCQCAQFVTFAIVVQRQLARETLVTPAEDGSQDANGRDAERGRGRRRLADRSGDQRRYRGKPLWQVRWAHDRTGSKCAAIALRGVLNDVCFVYQMS